MKKKILIGLVVIIALIVGGSIWYVNDYYHSNVDAFALGEASNKVHISEEADGLLFDGPGEKTALIFYPGAKVEYTAYSNLMYKLAEKGIDCYIVKMPGNLAFMGMNKAADVKSELASANHKYDTWYLSGHSLGGAMAASYVAKNPGEFSKLVLLAAYPTKSIDQKDLSVITIYGSEDEVVNMEKIKEGRKYMPKDYEEICIEGGNHAYFGNYGVQDGDGLPKISADEEQDRVVEAIGE